MYQGEHQISQVRVSAPQGCPVSYASQLQDLGTTCALEISILLKWLTELKKTV